MLKKSLLLSLALSFSFGLFAQDVEQTQRALITKMTASWCPPCGSWGWTLFDDLVADNSETSLLLSMNYSGDLMSDDAATIVADNFGGTSQPRFFFGNADQSASSGNAATKRTEIKAAAEALNMENPLANTGMFIYLSEDMQEITVQTKTKFFEAADGDYHLGVYLIEDGVINNQAGDAGANAVHKNVMRTALTDNTFGLALMNGAIAMDTEFDNELSIAVNSGWNLDNVKIAAIVWEKTGDTYTYVNGFMRGGFDTPPIVDNTNEVFTNASMTLAPNVTTSTTQVQLNVENTFDQATITLMDVNGRNLSTIFTGTLNAGDHSFLVERNAMNAAGIYFVVLEANGKRLTKQLIVK